MLKEKIEELQQKILKEVKSFYKDGLVSFVVFGSAARRTYRFDSDLDVQIIAENLPRGRIKRVTQFMAVEEKIEPSLRSLQPDITPHLEKLAHISKRLRKERELAFYGDIDFIPTEEYTSEDANEAIKDAEFVVDKARKLIAS